VHCRSYVAAETGLKLKKKFGVKMLFDMRGFWADEKVDNGQWNLKKPVYKKIYKHYKKKESEFLSQADGIISLTEASKKILAKQARVSVDVIPCCADLERFDYNKISEQEKQTLRASLNMPEHSKVLTYVGSIGGWYLTKEMFQFFKLLNQQYPEWKMLVLSKDSKEKIRAEMIQAGISEDKFWIDYANRDDLPRYLSLTTCGIFFIKNSYSKIASSPTKHAELMGMGIPVICNDIGDTGAIVNETRTGFVVKDFSIASFSNAMEQIGELEKIDKEYIRNCAKDIFDLQTGVSKYLMIYQKIFSATFK
jgi:glycosyltransferase involved in cell wall biosynthesis